MEQEYSIPKGNHCLVADKAEVFSELQCPYLKKEMGGSGSVGCDGVIVCPMRVYRCNAHPEYELAVRRTSKGIEVLKCPECAFDCEMRDATYSKERDNDA